MVLDLAAASLSPSERAALVAQEAPTPHFSLQHLAAEVAQGLFARELPLLLRLPGREGKGQRVRRLQPPLREPSQLHARAQHVQPPHVGHSLGNAVEPLPLGAQAPGRGFPKRLPGKGLPARLPLVHRKLGELRALLAETADLRERVLHVVDHLVADDLEFLRAQISKRLGVGRESPSLGELEVENGNIQPALRRDPRVKLAQRAGGGVAGIGKGLLPVLLARR